MHCFRVPFNMSELSLLGVTEPEYELQKDGGQRVWLVSTVVEQPLSEATSLTIRGEGYASDAQALTEGERWRDVVSRALARLHLAADFGDRRPFGGLTTEGKELLSAQKGQPMESDMPGVTTFPCSPQPLFVRFDAKGCRRPSPEQNQRAFVEAAILGEPFRGPERLAFDLFSGSFFQPSADARLLMLTMAVETLLDLQSRSHAAREHVQTLIAATESARLNPAERDSLIGSIRWLFDESIGQAGRRLAETLEPRRYMGLSPSAFFTRCYSMRSSLIHGSVPRPERNDVDSLAANMEVFVGHLLSGELLERVPD
jgi:hypothetical protein